MFGSELRLWITSLLPAEAVGLIRSLLLAEANRLRCGTGAVRMSGNLTAPDAGVDARTHLLRGGGGQRSNRRNRVVARPHRGLDLIIPDFPSTAANEPAPLSAIARRDRLGGLIHEYERAA
jgi:hypothetical protein